MSLIHGWDSDSLFKGGVAQPVTKAPERLGRVKDVLGRLFSQGCEV